MMFEIIAIQQLLDNVSQRRSLIIYLISLIATTVAVFLTEVLLESSVDAVLKQAIMSMPFPSMIPKIMTWLLMTVPKLPRLIELNYTYPSQNKYQFKVSTRNQANGNINYYVTVTNPHESADLARSNAQKVINNSTLSTRSGTSTVITLNMFQDRTTVSQQRMLECYECTSDSKTTNDICITPGVRPRVKINAVQFVRNGEFLTL